MNPLHFRSITAVLSRVTLLAAALALLASAAPSIAAARPAARGGQTQVALTIPSPGDVTYGIAEVRIDRPATRTAPIGGARGGLVWSQRVGGLSMVATAHSWAKLRGTTRVYVVDSLVPGAAANVRKVAFFVIRSRSRSRGYGGAGGQLHITVGNARPDLGTFWVHGADRAGNARIFAVANMLSTAVDNWSRYVAVLQVAHAVQAALHPRVIGYDRPHARAASAQTAAQALTASAQGITAASAQGHRGRNTRPHHAHLRQAVWTGGARPDRLTTEIFSLIVLSLHNPRQFALVKDNPIVPQFISTELGNPTLALRWQQVVSQLPLTVPDRYAAGAAEEARFGHVVSPKITRALVTIKDKKNSTDQNRSEDQPVSAFSSHITQAYPEGDPVVDVQVFDYGTATGTVIATSSLQPDTPQLRCPATCSTRYAPPAAGATGTVTLTAIPGPGSKLVSGFGGCQQPAGGPVCTITIPRPALEDIGGVMIYAGTDYAESATFVPAANTGISGEFLTVSRGGTGDGTITSSPAGIDCGPAATQCKGDFENGQVITLTATPASGSTFSSFSGCDSVSGNTCTLTILADRQVSATFASSSTLATGTPDPAFGSNGVVLTQVGSGTQGGDGAGAVARQSDGRYVVAGTGSTTGGQLVTKVARYNPDGSLDTTFGDAASGGGHTGIATLPATINGKLFGGVAVGIQPSGDIVVAGTLSSAAYNSGDFGVVRLTPAGALDTSFGSGGAVDSALGTAGTDYAYGLAVDSGSGALYVAGSAQTSSSAGSSEPAVAAYTTDGSPLSSFGSGGAAITPVTGGGQLQAIALDGSNVVAAGGANGQAVVLRYSGAGALDPSFNGGNPLIVSLGGSYSAGEAVLIRADHSVVIGGEQTSTTSSSGYCMTLAHITAGGSRDTSFGSAGIAANCGADSATGLAQTGDGGRIYAVGSHYTGSSNHIVLSAFTAAGALDAAFGSGGSVNVTPAGTTSSQGFAMLLDGGKPVVAGQGVNFPSGSATPTIYFAVARFS